MCRRWNKTEIIKHFVGTAVDWNFVSLLLGRLFDRVDLIKPVSHVRLSVRTYVRPSTKSFFNFNEIWRACIGQWVLHDGITDPSQCQGHEPLKVGNTSVFKSYLWVLRYLQWELPTDHIFLNYGTESKFDQAGFLIFGLVFVSRDFEVGRKVSCEESTVSPILG